MKNQTVKPDKKTIRILVVEDNLLNQKLAGFMLSDWGFKYDILSNGKFAIENLKFKTYDLILLDIQMPELNGYETAQHIRKILRLELPIIAMTAHAMPGEKEKCLSVGMTDYISKPINEPELLNMLKNYLSPAIVNENMINTSDSFKKVANLDYLSGLSRGNAEFVNEMVGIFLLENPKEIESLEKAIRGKNFYVIKQAAHFLLSSVPFVGLDIIIWNEVCEIEKIAEDELLIQKNGIRTDDNLCFEKIELLFSKIKESCEKACQELQKSS